MVFAWIRDVFAGKPRGSSERSPKWTSVRNAFIAKNPKCEACGSDKSVEAHHVLPYHVRPDLELVESNLIPLCRSCHYFVGHGYDWQAWRPDCRSLSKVIKASQIVRK